MFGLIKKLFAGSPAVNFGELVKNGAQIIDVRSKAEFSSGHVKGAVNIPLNILENNLSKIRKDKPVITCCASGMRSGSARGLLKSKGYEQVYNGGGWMSLQHKIK